MKKEYNTFINLLDTYKSDKIIKVLYRGISKKDAYNTLSLDGNINTMEDFAKKLFFFGEKSRYFWNEKIKSSKQKFNFGINEISKDFFKYIFKEFNNAINTKKNEKTKKFFDRSSKITSFFLQPYNIELFIKQIELLSDNEKLQARNYYLKILHQLGETEYKNNSQFVSSSTKKRVAKIFTKDKIIINFWDTYADNREININIPKFIGRPYKEQNETSVFAVILPHYIYSFSYNNIIFPNPAIKTTKDLESAIFCGLDIEQDNFVCKLKNETNLNGGIETNEINYTELK